MAATSFNTTNATFRQLMANGLRYHVPPFQRDYSWGADEWEELWQDIAEASPPAAEGGDSGGAHYMGYLVLQSHDNKQFTVIDGQQRLTTISVMILAVLKHLQTLIDGNIAADNNKARLEQLRNSYIGYVDPVSLESQSKLHLNRQNDEYYQHYLVPLAQLPHLRINASERRLRQAFNWFYDNIKQRAGESDAAGADAGKVLAAFIDGFVDKLLFTVITVTDELNAFKVFETLNARGVRLSAADMLKNHLFSEINSAKPPASELGKLEGRWRRINDTLGGEKFPEFLRAFWNGRYPLTSIKDLFKTIRAKIAGREEAFKLIHALDGLADVYAAFRQPYNALWNEREKKVIEQLAMLNVSQPFSLFMTCYEKWYDARRAEFTSILEAVAVLSFRYVICGVSRRELEGLYNGIALKVFDNTLGGYRDVLAMLRKGYLEDNRFKTAFAERALITTSGRNTKILRYILFAIEAQEGGARYDVENRKYTIEHILPENASEEWSSHIEESRQEEIVYKIGNMTLLEEKKNREGKNAAYAVKRALYEDSVFHITRQVAERYDVWDESKIVARQKRMAKVAAGIWRLEFN